MSFADMAVLFVLALLLFGPKKLPGIARQIGKVLSEFKRASNEFKAQIESEINQLEFQEKQKAQEKQSEQEQKILPPVAPPPESVEASQSLQAEPAASTTTEDSAAFHPATSNETSSVSASQSTNA